MVSAEIGRPPMAYTSLSALVAATWPKSSGSSRIGVKKSTVCTMARSSREAIDGCVVAGFEADDHVGIELRRKALEHRV